MKKVILSIAVVTALVFTGCKSEKKDTPKVEQTETKLAVATASFGVRGNCGMCKTTIEKAANSIDGVTEATWDKDKKKMNVSFDASKTDTKAVEAAVASSGYDTENVIGNLDAYENLPACCKYDHKMEMNQTGEVKSKDTH